jgi:hypothetical protein
VQTILINALLDTSVFHHYPVHCDRFASSSDICPSDICRVQAESVQPQFSVAFLCFLAEHLSAALVTDNIRLFAAPDD